ncbi:MAG: DUF7305 domain-containing protein [Candidatus Methylomirabilales bacterium]
MKMKKGRGQEGIALVLTLLVMTILLIMASAFMTISSTETLIAINERNRIQAYHLAEAGAERAIAELNVISSYGGAPVGADPDPALGPGTYRVTVTCVPAGVALPCPPPATPDQRIITATGCVRDCTAVGRAQATVQMHVQRLSITNPPYSGSTTGINPPALYNTTTHDLTVGNNQGVTLAPGTYSFNKITLGHGADLVISPPGQVTIYMTGRFYAGAGATINSVGVPTNLLIFSNNPGTDDLGEPLDTEAFFFCCNDASTYGKFRGAIYAPNGEVEFQNALDPSQGWEIYGAIVAKKLDIEDHARLHYDVALAQTSIPGFGAGSSPFQFAMLGVGSGAADYRAVQLENSVQVDSYDSAVGPYNPFSPGTQGHIHSNGKIELGMNNLVKGNAQAVGSITPPGAGNVITGTSTSGVASQSPGSKFKPVAWQERLPSN